MGTPVASMASRRHSDVLIKETTEDGGTRTLLRLGQAPTLDENVLGRFDACLGLLEMR